MKGHHNIPFEDLPVGLLDVPRNIQCVHHFPTRAVWAVEDTEATELLVRLYFDYSVSVATMIKSKVAVFQVSFNMVKNAFFAHVDCVLAPKCGAEGWEVVSRMPCFMHLTPRPRVLSHNGERRGGCMVM